LKGMPYGRVEPQESRCAESKPIECPMTVILKNLALAGYRSFGRKPQYFDQFAKVNLLIGRNNAGKSNVIRFLHEVYGVDSNTAIPAGHLSRHKPGEPAMLVGAGSVLTPVGEVPERLLEDLQPVFRTVAVDSPDYQALKSLIVSIYAEKRKLEGTTHCWHLYEAGTRNAILENWRASVQAQDHRELPHLWAALTGRLGELSNSEHINEIERLLHPRLLKPQVAMIPAIRQIGAKGTVSEGFDGQGIIERLGRLQNPDLNDQADKQRFDAINQFLRSVTDSPEASIDVPRSGETLLVHMSNQVLPIESLGTGIHEVIILAAAATVLKDHVVCIEEPELHLNPILQRKLMRYLSDHTDNQYFITTHSPVLMDTPDAEIYHVTLVEGVSQVERVSSTAKRSAVCEDLGYHPSDLLQANSVIWVEGPSDRIYLNFWLQAKAPELTEGVDYSIMFYGGRLASHLSNKHEPISVDDLIELRALNRRGAILMDSDKDAASASINSTKQRLEDEFSAHPGLAWVSAGREIENYLPPEQLRAAIKATSPSATQFGEMNQYDNCLSCENDEGKEIAVSKVKVAKYIATKFQADFSRLDLAERVDALLAFIKASQPK
jgi:hypothetical protein